MRSAIQFSNQRHRKGERGQTLLLVAASLISLLAMGAIAIDVVTLYVARTEAQRSADAAALAGGQELVANSVQSDPCNSSLASTAQGLATARASSVAQQNSIAGGPPDTVTVTYPNSGGGNCAFGIDPQIQVTVQRQNLPTFFARIWSRATNTVTAIATAEAYDPANASSVSGTPLPVAPSCVKPMLLSNCNGNQPVLGGTACPPSHSFFDAATGAITDPGAWVFATGTGGIIGEPLVLTTAYNGAWPLPNIPPKPGTYYPLDISAANSGVPQYYCPACASPGDPVFQQDFECCNSTTLQCGTVTVGSPPTVDLNDYPAGTTNLAEAGGQCLVHETSASTYSPACWANPNDQDCLNWSLTPFQFQAGNLNPFIGSMPGSLATGSVITTSDSIITVPVYGQTQQTTINNGTPITIIGFLQLFVEAVGNGQSGQAVGTIRTRVLNAVGCGTNATGPPVFGPGPAIPVRLIANP